MVIISKSFLKFFTNGFARAMALYPFIILSKPRLKDDIVVMNHERIHLRQQRELLLIGFYLWYLIEYSLNLLKHRNHYLAYRNISFEKESFHYQQDLSYLSRRRRFAFLQFL